MNTRKTALWNKKSCGFAFLVNLLIAAAAFAWTILGQGGLFSLAGDFNSQQIPFVMHGSEMVRSGGLFGFDYALDLGSGFAGAMSFYILGTPGFWIAQLFPPRYYMYIVGWLYVLKYAVAGLTSYIYFCRFVKQPRSALAGSVLYAFSGFMNENLLFYHFHDVVMLFPLLLITLDDLVEKKRRGPFILAVFLNAVVNYYFLIGEVIFLVLYYLIRWFIPDFRKYRSSFFRVFFEGCLGGALSMILLWPAFLFVIQNPRVKNDYSGSNALVFSAQRYLFILKGLLFPAEVMSDHTAVYARNFSSCAAYLPLTGMVLVIAYFLYKKKDWITGVLRASLVIACVPILNAAFSAFAGLYCRWYYMPLLLMALASAVMIDETLAPEPDPAAKHAVKRASIITAGISVFFILFLTLVKWSDSEPSLIYRPVLFGVYSAVSLLGIFLTWYLLCRNKSGRFRTFRFVLIFFAVVSTAGAVLSYQCEHGRLSNDLYDELVTSEQFITEPAYRIASNDNKITLAHGYAASGNFCSTVSGSIFRFYEAIGLRRDVKSPDPPDGLYTLISAAYRIDSRRLDKKSFLERIFGEASWAEEEPSASLPVSGTDNIPGYTKAGEFEGEFRVYTEYKSEEIPPIGFTYDCYMTRSDFDELSNPEKVPTMLRALIIEDKDAEKVSGVLTRYMRNTDVPLRSYDITALGLSHMTESSEEFEKDPSGFRSVITCAAPRYAFFSIPNDDGWTASVNGEDTEILDICGFMAVPVAAGKNEIRFSYETPGRQFGLYASLFAAAVSAIYLFISALLHLIKSKKASRAGETISEHENSNIKEAVSESETDTESINEIKAESENRSNSEAELENAPYDKDNTPEQAEKTVFP